MSTATPTSAPPAEATPAPAPAEGNTPAPAPAAAQGTHANASLYCGDLLPDVTEALLFDIFNAVGPVASVRICRDAATRRSLGYGYVNFHRAEDAERALDTMNFASIRGQPCRIMWSHRDPSLRRSGAGNIFVKNLDESIDNKTLYDTFSMFGNILSCKVATDREGRSLKYGFVHYESEESANAAIEQVNGMEIAGHEVEVARFKSKKERGGSSKDSFTNVFVKNLAEDSDDAKVRAMFEPYGTITSAMVAVDAEGKCKGFGFVNFAAPAEAAAAVEALNGKEVAEDKKLYVGRAQTKAEREKELRERFEQAKLERQKKYAGVNLYVKNLAEGVDKDKLVEEFSKVGAITSARVMTDDAGKSKGFGFVCFSTPEEATKAVTEMNGKMFEGKPLYVALAQRKDVRRAQLEAQHSARAKVPQMYPGPPMYYPEMQPRMMYPPQAAAGGRWNPGMPMRPGMPPMMPPYGMAPQPGMPPQGHPQQMQGGRGQQQRGGRQGGKGGKGGQQRGGGGGGNFKYTNQARNMDGQPPQQPPPQQQQQQIPPQQHMVQPQQPLTIQELAAAPEEQQKQMIGERLFPLIMHRQPEYAGKITGMLLEMDNGELLHLLESPESLDAKINEALEVLAAHRASQQAAGGAQ